MHTRTNNASHKVAIPSHFDMRSRLTKEKGAPFNYDINTAVLSLDVLASLNLTDPSPTPQPELLYRLAIQDILNRPVHVDNFTEDSALNQARIVYVNVPTQLRLNQVLIDIIYNYLPFQAINKCQVVFVNAFQLQVYVEVFCGWINFIVHTLLPYIGLITLNLLILNRLNAFAMHPGPGQHHNSTNSGGNSSSSNRRSSRIGEAGGGEGAKKKDVLLAKISLVIVFVFIVCHSVRWVPNVFELYLVSQVFIDQFCNKKSYW